MIKKTRNFIILISIVFAFGIAFLIQQLRYAHMPEIPEVVVIGTSADYPPFSFKEDHKIIGFDIDVATEAVKRLGKKALIKDIPFELLIPQAMMGEIHCIAAGLSKTPEREQKVYFSKVYSLDNSLVVLTNAQGTMINSLEDLVNKQVIVNKGYTADDYISKFSYLAIERVPTSADAIKALQAKKVDAFVTESQAIPNIFKEYGQEHFNFFVINETPASVAIAISKMHPELAKKISSILEQMHQDGTIDQLQQKWHIQ